MADLDSIDPWIHGTLLRKLPSAQQGLLSVLSSGAFVSLHHKSKFDTGKNALCPLCQVQNDVVHWFSCPTKQEARISLLPFGDEINNWPLSFRCHLLPPRCALLDELDGYFTELPTPVTDFHSNPHGVECQHLFTDGSCMQSTDQRVSWASWAVLNATSGLVIASSPVAGLEQTVGRSEVLAILCALEWTLSFHVQTCVWSDSQYAVKGIWHLQTHLSVPRHWAHQDLWLRILDLLQQLSDECFQARWIPAHLDAALCEHPFEDWVQLWNNRVDQMAVYTNRNRPISFFSKVAAIEAYDARWLARSKALLDFFGKAMTVPSAAATSLEVINVSDSDEEQEDDLLRLDLLTYLPEDWEHQWEPTSCKYPLEFARGLVCWLQERTSTDLRAPCKVYSFLEIAIGMAMVFPAKFPFSVQKADWKMQFVTERLARPTASSLVHAVRSTLLALLKCFHLEHLLQPCGCLSNLGIYVPQVGLRLALSRSVRVQVEAAVKSFTSSRALRRACDLARPF